MNQGSNAEKVIPEDYFSSKDPTLPAQTSGTEYSKIQRLLSDMSTAMASSVEQIHNINLTMRMISFNSKIEAVRSRRSRQGVCGSVG